MRRAERRQWVGGRWGGGGRPHLPRLERQRVGTHGVGLVVPRHVVCQRAQGQCAGEAIRRARRGWPAHRRWDGASRTPRRPLAAGFGAVRASQAGGGTSCGVQCCASGMQWMWCSPRAVRFGPRLPKPARSDHGRARSRRTGRPWAAWARVLCAEQQLQLVGARGAAPHSPPRGAPVASCCVRVRARTEGARGARWAWAGCGVAGTESEEWRRKTRCSSAPRAYST